MSMLTDPLLAMGALEEDQRRSVTHELGEEYTRHQVIPHLLRKLLG